MPKRPRSRHRPPVRKKVRRRLDIPGVAPQALEVSEASSAVSQQRVVPPPYVRASAPATSHPQSAHADYSYVKGEVRRIAILTAGILILLIVISIVLV